MPIACDALLTAIGERGWRGSVIRTGPEFRRLDISRAGNDGSIEQVLIDLAIDSPPTKPPMVSFAGPTLDVPIEELRNYFDNWADHLPL